MMVSNTATATATSSSVSSSPVLTNSEGRGGMLRRKSPDGTTVGPPHAVPSDENNSSGDPLPPELRRILVEVARTGQCSWLSWNSNNNASSTQQDAISEAGGNNAASSSAVLKSSQNGTNRQVLVHRHNATPSSYPRSSSPLHNSAPPRKKRRNGLYSMSRRRYDGGTGKSASGTSGGTTRKRPLFLIRTTSSSSGMFSTGSVGSSGRTSGSEPEDSTQYECDSEGTSATTNSELSLEQSRREQQLRNKVAIQNSTSPPPAFHNSNPAGNSATHAPKYPSLREAVRVALGLVLDHSFKHLGGYKLSPAELRRNAAAAGQDKSVKVNQQQNEETGSKANSSKNADGPSETIPLSPEVAFQQRLKRLMALMGDPGKEIRDSMRKGSYAMGEAGGDKMASARRVEAGSIVDGPPFTLQRVAEVLASPDRYYTQTHKLCNCLEKLLLVTSSSSAFGGSTGGDTTQSRREERELAALANEKGRERRLRRRPSSSSDDVSMDANDSHGGLSKAHDDSSPLDASANDDAKKGSGRSSPEKSKSDSGVHSDHAHGSHSTNHGPGSREYLEARASLRSKFDHVGVNAHAASASVELESGGRPSSPPPPTHNTAMQDRYVRQHLQEHASGEPFNDPVAHNHHLLAARPPSPVLFSSSSSDSGTSAAPTPVNPLSPNSNMQLLQMHHSAALATLSGTPLDLVIDPISSGNSSTPASITAAALLEVDPGRSSASNSDVDSESDDISLDDSASDRSDGSDSGTAHHEPFTAARVMALNRMQQQQQRLQKAPGSQFPDGFKPPPADTEYQSGDSIDSMVAEDSGGSDSSSSDLAD